MRYVAIAKQVLIPLLIGSLASCAQKDSNSSAGEAGQSGNATGANVTVSGQLAVDNLSAEVTDGVGLDRQKVQIRDSNDVIVTEAFSGKDGQYVAVIPGSLLVSTGSSLTLATPTFHTQAIIPDTANGSVIGVNSSFQIPASGGGVSQGKIQLEKITAIRGQVTLDGALDHTGVSIFVPGTSYAARSDSAGYYLMTFLQQGTYELVFEKGGYTSAKQLEVAVTDGETAKVTDTVLRLAGGAGAFSVKQIGTESLSASRTVRFSVTPGNADRFKGGPSEIFETLSYGKVPDIFEYTFDSDGVKTIEMTFATADGFETHIERTITVDTAAPTITGLSLADRSSLSTGHANERRVIAYHASCADIDRVAILPETRGAPTEADFIWPCHFARTSSDFTFELPVSQGSFAYKLWARDAVGNVSSSSIAGSIDLDTTAPVAPSLTIKDQTSESPAGTDQTVVNVQVSGCDDIAKILISESQVTKPSAEDFSTSCNTATTYTYTFANNIAENKTLLAWALDAAGNVGPVSTTSQIVLDQTRPSAPSFTLQDPSSATAGYTNSLTVALNVAHCSDTTHLLASETQTTAPTELATGWVPCATTGLTTTLSSSGTKTVYLWARDIGGNVSLTSSTASIIADTTSPAAPSFSLVDSTNGSSAYTNAATVNVTIAACADTDKIYLTEGVEVPTEVQVATQCAASVPFTLTGSSETLRTVRLWSKDLSGNVSASPSSATITFDTSAPALPGTFAVSDTSSSSTAFANGRTLNFTVDVCPAGDFVLVANGQSTAPSEGAAGWTACALTGTLTNILDATEGSQTIYLWTKDGAGNLSTTSKNHAITYDVTAPTAPPFNILDFDGASSEGFTNALTVKMTISSCTGIAGITFSESNSAPAEGSVTTTCSTTAGAFQHTFSGGDGTKALYLWVKDAAGNVASSSDSIEYDTSAPTLSNEKVAAITKSSVRLTWTTSEAVPSVVRYGTVSGTLGSTKNDGGSTTSHDVTVSGLSPFARYYFAAEATDYAQHSTAGTELSAYTLKVAALQNQNVATFLGGPASDSKHQRHSVACDLNNDGKDDLVVSAPKVTYTTPNPDRPEAGAVYIIYGEATPAATLSLPGDADVIYYGNEDNARLGNDLQCLDFNGDGTKDLLMARTDQFVYLVYGSNALVSGEHDIGSSYDVRFSELSSGIRGIASGHLRPSGSGATDAYADVVICAPNSTEGCRIYYGGNFSTGTDLSSSEDAEPGIDTDPTTADSYAEDMRGVVVADVDGDGLDDLVMGSGKLIAADFINPLGGGFYVLAGGTLPTDPTPGSSGTTQRDLRNAANYSYVARGSVGSLYLGTLAAGDIDGDGKADIFIRNLLNSYDPWRVVFGRSAAAWSSGVSIDQTGLRFKTDASITMFPNSQGAAGNFVTKDLDGDGKNEVIFGSDGDASGRGKFCIFKGRSQAAWNALANGNGEITFASADACFTGADAGDYLGLSLAVGNFDGNGPAILFTAPGGDGVGNAYSASGEAGLVFFKFPSSYSLPLSYSLTPDF